MTLGGDVVGGADRARQLRADAPARALRQERHEGRPAVPRGEAGHRRPRAVDEGGPRVRRDAVGSRTSSRRATRSATGGPGRSSARTRSAACGAVRPTAATSRRSRASKLAFAPRGKLDARQRDQARPVGDRAQEGATQRRRAELRPGARRWRRGCARPLRRRGSACAGADGASDVKRACSPRRCVAAVRSPMRKAPVAPAASRTSRRRACRARRASSAPSLVRSIARHGAPATTSATARCCPMSTAARRVTPMRRRSGTPAPHSFASFGNPIYRVNVELARNELGKHGEPALRRLSRHAADGRWPDGRRRCPPTICARTPA